VEHKWLAHDVEDSARDVIDYRRRAKTLQEDHELVTAESSDSIAWTGRPNNARGNLLQGVVTCVVAQTIVDGLKAVEVDHQDGDRIDRPTIPGEGMAETVKQECSVRESCQGVFECLTRQLLFECPADCDVSRVPCHGRQCGLQGKIIRGHLESPPTSVGVANADVEGGNGPGEAQCRQCVECDLHIVGIKESIEWFAAEFFSGHSKKVSRGGTAVLGLTNSARQKDEIAAAFNDRFKPGTGLLARYRHRLDPASSGVPKKSQSDQ
jgi:hypothetical protein